MRVFGILKIGLPATIAAENDNGIIVDLKLPQ
jgi:hypothetical protein